MTQEDLFAKSKMDKVNSICEAWNQYAPVKHSVFTKCIKGAVANALDEYGSEEIIISAIKKYATVCNNDDYWWSIDGYLLDGFLRNGLTRFVDTPLDGFKRSKPKTPSNLLPKL